MDDVNSASGDHFGSVRLRSRIDNILDELQTQIPSLDLEVDSDGDNDENPTIFTRKLPKFEVFQEGISEEVSLEEESTLETNSVFEESKKLNGTPKVFSPPKSVEEAEKIYDQCFGTKMPQFNFKNFTEQDLDKMLDEMAPFEKTDQVKLYFNDTDSQDLNTETYQHLTVIDKLQELSKRQSDVTNSVSSGDAKFVAGTFADEAVVVEDVIQPTPQVASIGCSTDNYRPTFLPQPHDYSKTVFIDLSKEFEDNEYAIAKTKHFSKETSKNASKIFCASSSSEDEGEEQRGSWIEERRRIKEMISKGENPNFSAVHDSIKNETVRTKKKIRTETSQLATLNFSPKPRIRISDLPIEEQERFRRTSLRSRDKRSPMPKSEPQSLDVQITENKTIDLTPKEASLPKEPESKSLAQRNKERKSRQRLYNMLDGSKPCKCENGDLPSASHADTLFDLEESYADPIPSLPDSTVSKSENITLLTVNLSSSASIVTCKGLDDMAKTPNQIDGTYYTLISWFMSLTVESGHDVKCPFMVIGMQQITFQKQFLLQVAVTPSFEISILRQQYAPLLKKKPADKSWFQWIIHRFFCTKHLAQLLSWQVAASLNSNADVPLISTRPLSHYVNVIGSGRVCIDAFDMIPGYYWATLEAVSSPTASHHLYEQQQQSSIQTAFTMLDMQIASDGQKLNGVLYRLLQVQLDLVGLRMGYPSDVGVPSHYYFRDSESNPKSFVLVLALCGVDALSMWQQQIGPPRDFLSRDSIHNASIMSRYATRETAVGIFCPRLNHYSHIVRWFGGRVHPSGTISTGRCLRNSHFSDPDSKMKDESAPPPAFLTTVLPSDCVLLLLPVFPFSGYLSNLLDMLSAAGYAFTGIKRTLISAKIVKMFSGLKGGIREPLTLIKLTRPNALFHSASLSISLPFAFSDLGSNWFYVSSSNSALSFFDSSLSVSDWNEFPRNPGSLSLDVSYPSLVVLVCLKSKYCRHLLGEFKSSIEIVGVNCIEKLSRVQSRELTCYEAGDSRLSDSLNALTGSPCVAFLLRGFFTVLPQSSEDVIISLDPYDTYRRMRLFFNDSDLFPDKDAQTWADYMPPCATTRFERIPIDTKKSPKSQNNVQSVPVESITSSFLNGPPVLSTLLVLKPSIIPGILPAIVKNLFSEHMKIVGCDLKVLSNSESKRFMPEKVLDSKFEDWHLRELQSGPCLILAIEAPNAVKKLFDLIGPDDPRVAKKSAPLSWRAQFAHDPVNNAFYCSPSYNKSVDELNYFFKSGLCSTFSTTLSFADDPIVAANIAGTRKYAFTRRRCDGVAKELNCIILSSYFLNVKSPALYDFFEFFLHMKQADVVGLRMAWFSRNEVSHLLNAMHCSRSDECSQLYMGPCLILALQRENICTCFDSLLGDPNDKSSLYYKYNAYIFRPSTMSDVENALGYLFDSLSPKSIAQISLL